MKILHVCHNYFPSQGGSQYVMKHLSEKLINYYQDSVDVCTSNSFYAPEYEFFQLINPPVEIISGVKVYRKKYRRWHYPFINYSRKISFKLFSKDLPYYFIKLRKQLDSQDIKNEMKNTIADIIMATTASYSFADYPLWREKKFAKPFVLFGAIHFDKDLKAKKEYVKRAVAADCYIANTEFEKNQLIVSGVNKEKIKVCGIGIDPADFLASNQSISSYKNSLGISANDIVITFIGRIKSGKGVDILLSAFEILLNNNIYQKLHLLLAGTYTEHVEMMRKKITVKKLPVTILCDFPEEEKKLMLHAADIFVLPSASESFGVVFLEAWACKKPVIGAATGAISSVIDDGIDGLLFKPADENDLAEKLSVLIADAQLRQTMGNNGYKKIQEKYTWPVVTKKFRDAYLFAIESFKDHAGK